MARFTRLLLAWLALAVGFGAATSASAAPRDTLILISIDGFRSDYIKRGVTPTLAGLAADGVTTTAMHPSFPSVTMPNHYTIVTGLRPDHHGIVDNTMLDPAMPGQVFGGPHRSVELDPRWWNEATPIWVSAERQGITTAAMFWPGSDVAIHDVRPSYWRPYDEKVTSDQRVDQVLQWLDLPEGKRPRFVTLYFDPVDENGHDFGPDSPQVNAALAEVDHAIARLMDGLKSRGALAHTNIVIIADHGMTATATDRVIFADDLIDVKGAVIPTFGAYLGVDPLPGHEAEIAAALLKPHEHLACWRKADIPARLHYGTNPRVPAIFCLADKGWTVVPRQIALAYPKKLLGNHGFDPDIPEMSALFIAHGPAFRKGVALSPFDNVDVYPMLARVLAVAPEHADGELAPLEPGLRASGS